jgi:hypothetical protein
MPNSVARCSTNIEATLIEEKLEPLTRCELAAGVLGLDAFLAAAEPRLGPLFLKPLENLFHGLRTPASGAV